jgi:hypothetical protein
MTKKEISELKGIAIILMFWHHLFGCGNGFVLPENIWIPMIRLSNNWESVDRYFGSKSKLCIALFAAASGYGLYRSYIVPQQSRIFKRIVKFLISYWTLLFLAVIPCLIYLGKFEPRYLLINMFNLLDNEHTYASFSWYVKVYLMILLVLPIVKRLQKYVTKIWLDVLIFVIAPLLFYHILPDNEGRFTGIITFLLSSLRLLCTWYPEFHVGLLIAKYSLDEKTYNKIKDKLGPIILLILSIIVMIATVFLRTLYRDFACVFVFLIAFYCFTKSLKSGVVHNTLAFLGKYSFQYWILSGLFFVNTTEFQWLLYLPRFSPLILIWSFVIMTIPAILLAKISEILTKPIESRL